MNGESFTKRKSLGAMLFIIAIVHLMSGCIFSEQAPLEISLAPKISTPSINIGGDTKIYLSVLDQRTDKILGYSGYTTRAPIKVAGTISASENVEAVIHKSLKDGLASLGFETLTTPEPSVPKLEVAVQHLRWMPSSRFDATISGKLYKGDTLRYEKSYGYFRGQKVFCWPNDKSCFEENFNAALSDLMGQLLADLKLLEALRK